MIQGLKRKYGDTIPAILEFAENARQQLDAITHAAERIAELDVARDRLLRSIGQQGQALSGERHTAAGNLEKAIEHELADLHMSGARFKVAFQQHSDPEGAILENGERLAFNVNGLEKVEFLIAPNPGEGF